MAQKPVGIGHKRRIYKVQDTMVYVPILKTLATLLKTDCVTEQVGKTLVYMPEQVGKTLVYMPEQVGKTLVYMPEQVGKTLVYMPEQVGKTLVYMPEQVGKTLVYMPEVNMGHGFLQMLKGENK